MTFDLSTVSIVEAAEYAMVDTDAIRRAAIELKAYVDGDRLNIIGLNALILRAKEINQGMGAERINAAARERQKESAEGVQIIPLSKGIAV